MSITSTQKYIATPLGQLFSQAWQVKSCDKAPIILLHDSLGCIELWRDFPSQLAHITQRTVIAYDRLGFGKSSLHPAQLDADFVLSEAIEDFKALLAAYEVNNFVVMAYTVNIHRFGNFIFGNQNVMDQMTMFAEYFAKYFD